MLIFTLRLGLSKLEEREEKEEEVEEEDEEEMKGKAEIKKRMKKVTCKVNAHKLCQARECKGMSTFEICFLLTSIDW